MEVCEYLVVCGFGTRGEEVDDSLTDRADGLHMGQLLMEWRCGDGYLYRKSVDLFTEGVGVFAEGGDGAL